MKMIETDPNSVDAQLLMNELSDQLESITGNSGKGSFDTKDVCVPRALFVVAYDDFGEALGCGAIRPINESIAEVKRMYAKFSSRGIGTEILYYLEVQARKLGYSTLWLETRLINQQAVSFYESKGYCRIPNYGKYIGNSEAVCFEKKIV